MIKIICDYCSEPDPVHKIVLSRTPNDEQLKAELCNVCLADIMKYAEEQGTF